MKIKFFKLTFLKNLLPRSLFARSLLILTVPIILTLSISTYIFFDRHWERMAGRLAMSVAGEVAFLVEQIEQDASEESIKRLVDGSLRHMQISVKYVGGGKIKPDPVDYLGRGGLIKKTLSKELKQRVKYPYRILVDVEEKWIQIQIQIKQGAVIVTSPERRLFSSSGFVFLIWMVGVSSILLAVATLFMRNQIRPIKRLAIAAERFGKGRDVPFFKVEGAREVRQAARAFLGMRERINKQIQQRTSMLAGVSHDLRTPLTRIKLQVEMMEKTSDSEALKNDINEMQRMIDAYLQFARGEGSEEMERVDISEMVTRLSHNYARQNFSIHLNFVDTQNFSTFLRPVAFERCLNNILSNAQKYANEAWLTLRSGTNSIYITVDDDGPGIGKGHYDDVFKPFFREDEARNIKSGSVGLGLPIAQDIVLAHGGDIELSKSSKNGLRVEITLPV
jgi:two-component system osmolarity sensor histidine kinase EnvZ